MGTVSFDYIFRKSIFVVIGLNDILYVTIEILLRRIKTMKKTFTYR